MDHFTISYIRSTAFVSNFHRIFLIFSIENDVMICSFNTYYGLYSWKI